MGDQVSNRSTRRKIGTLEPVIYFVNETDPRRPRGHIVLAPYSSFPCPSTHRAEAAETISEVNKLQSRLIEQTRAELIDEKLSEESATARARERVVDSLRERMISSSTSAFERDFITHYLWLRDEKKREKWRGILEGTQMYLHALEMDQDPARGADEERVNLDRIHF